MMGATLDNGEMLLARLSKLDANDRAWLMGQLSAQQRAALMDLAQTETQNDRSSASHVATREAMDELSAALRCIRAARADEVVETLSHEPAWLVQAVLALDEWPWKDEALRSFPSAVRAAVIQGRALAPSQQVRDALIRHVAANLPRADSFSPKPSALRRIVRRLERALNERRLTFRT